MKTKYRAFPEHMKPERHACADCGMIGDTILLVNGQDRSRYCEVCLKDQLYDMAINNDSLSIINLDDSLELL